MDFPVCPSCRQSVLDDDATDCPFCGASMKAKPGTKPAPTAPKTPAVAAKPMGGKVVPNKPTLPGDDLPFESELTAGKSAILAMPNPTKQRTLQVICPMCDTPGYLPPTAAGQNVRCANPKCVMPVFTAPAPKPKEAPAPPPPPPKASNLPMIGAITLLAVALFAGGLYLTLFQTSRPKVKQLSEEDKALLAEMTGGNKKTNNNAAGVNADNGTKPGVPVKETDETKAADELKTAQASQELIKAVLKQMKDSSLAADRQRSKPYCRQLAAEANAVTGNPVVAREHLEQLLKVGSDVSYYRINPLLDLFWSELGAGDKKAALKTLSNAVSETPKLPKFGRTRFEIIGRLSTAMAAAGQIPEAVKTLAGFQSTEAEAQLAARMQRATDGRVAPLGDTDSVLPWKFPQAAAVTFSLLNRGDLKTATAWALAQTTDEAKSECLAVWAEEFSRQKASTGECDAEGTIAAAVEPLAPPFAARVWARAGYGRWLAKDPAGVTKGIGLAQEKLATLTVPEEVSMPSVKTTQRFKRPAAEPLLLGAVAAGELAFLQAQSAETKAAAEKSLDLALAFVRATAPTYAAAQQRQDEAERLGPSGLRDLLKRELGLKSDDEARTAASNYKRSLSEIFEASQQKYAIEALLLSRLRGAGVGLNSKVWIIVSTRSTADDINRRENFFGTGLPGELAEGLKGTDEERAIRGAWGARSKEPLPRPPFIEFNDRLKTDLAGAVDYVQSLDNKGSRREELLLRTVSLLPTINELPTALQLISRLDDPIVREECYRFAAALGAQRGQQDLVWKQVALVPQNTEKVAICRGLIAGLLAAGIPADK